MDPGDPEVLGHRGRRPTLRIPQEQEEPFPGGEALETPGQLRVFFNSPEGAEPHQIGGTTPTSDR